MRSVGRFFIVAMFLYFLATGCLRIDQQRLAITASRIAITLAPTHKERVSSLAEHIDQDRRAVPPPTPDRP